MKNSYLSLSLIFIFLILLGTFQKVYGQNVFSQNNVPGMVPLVPVNGFIIMNTGDTLPGKIKYTKLDENYMSQIMFTAQDGEKTKYNAGQIKGLGIEWTYTVDIEDDIIPVYNFWDIYECKPSPKKMTLVFMNRLVEGKIKIFQNRSSLGLGSEKVKIDTDFEGLEFSYSQDEGLTIGSTYSIKSIEVESKTRYSSYYVEKKRGQLIKVEKDNYESLWPDLFGDCEGIIEEINKNPDLKKWKNFIILAEVYNHICYK